jgi:hypothetical protein
MPRPNKTLKNLIRYELERAVEPWAVKYVRSAMSGDVEAAFELALAAGNEVRGYLATGFWAAKVPLPAFRALFGTVWEHDHLYLKAAAQTRCRLKAMFRYGQFPLPPHLPETVRAWRGTSCLSPSECSRGLSWTLDRDVACWFAKRYSMPNPLVMCADVPKNSILFYSNERQEQEVVIFDSPKASIDGTPQEWHERFMAVGQAKASRTVSVCLPD